MTKTCLFRVATVVASVLATGGAAWAQSACQRYRAELASLGRGGGASQSYAAEAQRQRYEISRLAGYYSSIGCNQEQQFSFFGDGRPPECGAIAARIRSMQASYSAVAGRADADDGASEARRRELRGLVQSACAQEDALRRQREAEQRRVREERVQKVSEDEDDRPRRVGSGRTVCVRTCDGSFFPLSAEPDRGRENELCQALCPGTEAIAFKMPQGGDAEISQAVSLKGKPYIRLANAFKFQKSFDSSCACKKDGESWAQLLQKAESMIERRPGDLIVTAQKAEELSRPKLARIAARANAKGGDPAKTSTVAQKVDPKSAQELKQAADAKAPAAPADPTSEAAVSAATVAAANAEASGTEGSTAEAKPVVAQSTRPNVDVDVTGSTRKPRVVGPNVTGAASKKAP